MKKKKNSAMKKLIPATSMLLVSATMLTASTYAWFTMSREVEVTGIKMTATAPTNIELSFGSGTNNPTSGLAGTVGEITAPSVDRDTTDWANTLDFSQYYKAGKITPASSTDGVYIFQTPDATIQGKTVSDEASFTQATFNTANLVKLVNGSAYNSTEPTDTGYFIEFPIWFRTNTYDGTSGSPENVNLALRATITQRTADENDTTDKLYHAVRVAVIQASANTAGSNIGTTSPGVLMDTTADYYDRYYKTTSTGHSVLSDLSDEIDDQAVYKAGKLGMNYTADKTTYVNNTYGKVDRFVQNTTLDSDGYATNGEVVVTIPKGTGTEYGTAVKYYVRVWIEGEDKSCWNATANQDFNVDLRFIRLGSNTATVSNTNGTASDSTTYTAATYPSVTVVQGETTLTYAPTAAATGGYTTPTSGTWTNGYTWSFNGHSFASQDSFVTWLNSLSAETVNATFGSSVTMTH